MWVVDRLLISGVLGMMWMFLMMSGNCFLIVREMMLRRFVWMVLVCC